MLRDGQFLREPPIKIGAHYVPKYNHYMTAEEERVQEALLARDLVFWNRLVRKMVAI